MASYFCPITGEHPCKCPNKISASDIGSALQVDLKGAVRKLFTDHINYTNLVIIQSVPVLQEDAGSFVERLLKNPIDIANLLLPIIGASLAANIKKQFTDHLVLANDALQYVRNGDSNGIRIAVDKFYSQGNLLSRAIHDLSPNKLKLDHVQKLIREHNEFVVALASMRGQLQARTPKSTKDQIYKNYINTFDLYFKHGLGLADAIYEGLMP